jgi:nitroreductase/FMN reductase [NAD(P)H]
MTEQNLDALLRARFGALPTAPAAAAASPVLREMVAHRSHRRFRHHAVDPALLDTLLACAFSAPAKSDLQQACVVCVEDAALRESIDALFPRASWVATAPVFLVWCGDNRRIRRICELRDKPFANDHLDSFFNAAVDCALVMSNFIRAAQAVGLGCCPLSELRNHCAEVARLLSLPEHVFPVAGMVLGWPAGVPAISPRLPPAITVHRDRYDDADLPAQVDAYDARRHAVQPIAPERQRLTGRYGVAADYGWSEDKARQVSEGAREGFGGFVRGQGFGLE